MKYPEFKAVVSAGKQLPDTLVEGSLLRRALGYIATDVTRERIWDKTTDRWRMTITKKVAKHVPAETGAICFWLKNRKPQDWRDKRELEVTGNADTPLVIVRADGRNAD